MTQEHKDILLKDLCARLPYGVKVESVFINPDTKKHKLCGIEVFDATSLLMIRDGLGEFKPYLFPLSSMTEEQLYEITELFGGEIDFSRVCLIELSTLHRNKLSYLEIIAIIDWFLKNHFDIHELIPMGLAIDATNFNIY